STGNCIPLFPDIVMMFFFDFFIDIVFSPCCNKGYTYPVCSPGREAKRKYTGHASRLRPSPVAKRNADIQGTHLDCNSPGREAKRKYTGRASRSQSSRSRSETQIHRAGISLQTSCS
ncbi:MAG: hypothetical protein LBG13_02260, partial [Holosporales bacterium]|nr:hypothetical protein [Holosporales bacterium]